MERKNRTKIGLAAVLAAILALTISARPATKKEEQEDNLVRLMKAESIEQMEINGQQYRKAIAATFLHNGTYLISDTALWNVTTKVINCKGHVKVIQDETILTSQELNYFIDQDLAQFRGNLVQLQNKKMNILRTTYLDYNTKDSVALFRYGGSMRDKDGQIIESNNGTYSSRKKNFVFQQDVNMFSDSVFVRTETLYYYSEPDRAEFPKSIVIWKDKNILLAGKGWYDRANELFFFQSNVHGMSEDQEVWTDSLYFHRLTNEVLMQGNVQIQDSVRDVATLSNRAHYRDSIRQVDLWNDAAVALFTTEGGKRDTIYIGGDSLHYRHVRYCDIPDGTVKASQKRLKDFETDAVSEYRAKAAQAAQEAAQKESRVQDAVRQKQEKDAAAEEAKKQEAIQKKDERENAGRKGARKDAETPAEELQAPEQEAFEATESAHADSLHAHADGLHAHAGSITAPLDSTLAAIDSLVASGKKPSDAASAALRDTLAKRSQPTDSLTHALPSDTLRRDSLATAADSLTAVQDSLTAVQDSLTAPIDTLPPPDTTRYGFAWARGNVKIFRKDLQVRCDSMTYNDLDSIACLYMDPVVWNEGNRQYSSDSIFVLVGGGGARKASLQSNAFVITQDDEICFDQIKGAEIMAYFDSTDNSLKRFDALGGASALFYLEENGTLATVNKVETKMLSGTLVNGNIDRVYYFENPHNNAYPVVQLPKDESRMKGFTWRPDERPATPGDITPLKIKKPARDILRKRKLPDFQYTAVYFPGYIDGIRKEIARRDSLARIPRPVRSHEDVEPQLDTLFANADSVARSVDSLVTELGTVKDTPAVKDSSAASLPDSVSASKPATEVDPLSVPTVDPKQKKAEEREMRRQLRIAEKAAREAERERRWAQLDSLDAAKAAAKQQKALEKERAKKAKQLKAIQKREAKEAAKLEKYIEKYRKKYEREQKRQSARKRTPAVETGGEVPAPPGSGEKAPRGDAVLGDDGSPDDGAILGGGSVPGA